MEALGKIQIINAVNDLMSDRASLREKEDEVRDIRSHMARVQGLRDMAWARAYVWGVHLILETVLGVLDPLTYTRPRTSSR
jgi:hypothetical protein